MKKLMLSLLAVAALAVGAKAEGTGTLFNNGAYNVYRTSDAVSSATGQTAVASPCILHKVLIASPTYAVDLSTNSVFSIFDGQSSNGTLRAEVNMSTQSIISGAAEYTLDIAMSSGIWTGYNGTVTTGKVNLIYTRPVPGSAQGYRVWSSSYMATDTGVHAISAGPVLLHSIIVLTKGTGTAILTAYDSNVTASPSASNRIAAIDLTDTAREYKYDVLCSSGITVQSSGAGTVNPLFIVLYKRNPSQDYEVWRASFTTGTATTKYIAGTNTIFGGVVNGDSVASSSLSVYDSSATANSLITVIDGNSSFDRHMYDVAVSSGITYSSTGNGLYTILYKRR